MGIINKLYNFVLGEPANPDEVNENFDIIYNEVNGNLDNHNIVANAGIEHSKLTNITLPDENEGTAQALSDQLKNYINLMPKFYTEITDPVESTYNVDDFITINHNLNTEDIAVIEASWGFFYDDVRAWTPWTHFAESGSRFDMSYRIIDKNSIDLNFTNAVDDVERPWKITLIGFSEPDGE